MDYDPSIWVDRNIQFPNRYTDELGATKTFTASPGTITEAGTTLTAALMNKIEQRLAANSGSFSDTTTSILTGAEYTKTIPIGFSANRGRCTIDGPSGVKSIVFFDTDATHAHSVETTSLGFTMVRGDGSLMYSLSDDDDVLLIHCSISGTNLVMVFRNDDASTRTLNVASCLWEVTT